MFAEMEKGSRKVNGENTDSENTDTKRDGKWGNTRCECGGSYELNSHGFWVCPSCGDSLPPTW